MATIDLRFPPEVREVLLHLAEMISEMTPGTLLVRINAPEDDDPDFADEWLAGLTEGIEEDLSATTQLLGDPEFGEGPVELPDDQAFAALRGFTALRIALRESALITIPDDQLETGEADLTEESPALRHAYACYGAMSEIQAALCEILD